MILCCGKVSSYKQDSVWSWFISSCSALCMMLTIGFAFALGVLFPVFMDSFNENRERTAWVSSIVLGVLCFLGPVTGAFLNRFGIRISTILGCLLCSAGLTMGSFVHNIVILYITFSIPFAMGVSVIYVTATVIATHYFDKRRSIALGIVTAGQGLGTMILGPSIQALVDVLDWRNTFRVFAGILGVTSLTGCFLHQGTSPPNGQKESPPKKFSLNLSLFKNPTVLIMLVVAGAYTFSRMVPYVHLVKHCNDLGISADKSSTLYLFIGIFATVGRLGGGFLCNIKSVKAIRLFQVAAFIVGTSTMLLTLTKTYGALVAYAIVFSLADGIMVTTYIIALLNSVKEALRASTFGFSMMCAGVGALSSPPLSGLMADKAGNYIAAFLMAGGVGIISSLIPFLLLCFKREDYDTEDEELQGCNEDAAEREKDDLDPHLKPPSPGVAMESLKLFVVSNTTDY